MTEREHIKRDGPGRRIEDSGRCPVHDLLQDETKDHRVMVCGKISDVRRIAESAVPWKVFALAVTVLILVLGTFWGTMLSGQKDIKEVIKEVAVSVNMIENRQITVINNQDNFQKEIDAINKRQDILRDAYIKLMRDKE